jgi:hypothetical protein
MIEFPKGLPPINGLIPTFMQGQGRQPIDVPQGFRVLGEPTSPRAPFNRIGLRPPASRFSTLKQPNGGENGLGKNAGGTNNDTSPHSDVVVPTRDQKTLSYPPEKINVVDNTQPPGNSGHDLPNCKTTETDDQSHEVPESDLFIREQQAGVPITHSQILASAEHSEAVVQPSTTFPYMRETDRRRKNEAYSEVIAQGGYPLLYAVCVDLLTLDEREMNKGLRIFFPAVKITESSEERQNSIFLGGEEIRSRLVSGKIKFTEPPIVGHIDALYALPPGLTSASFTAQNEEDADLFGRAMTVLSKKLGQIPNSENGSLTVEVQSTLEEYVPQINQANTSGSALNGIYEGFFSVLRNAMYLSQRKVDEKDKLTTKERLLKVLRSDANTEFTKDTKLAVLANLPYVHAVPTHLLQRTDDDNYAVHPDTVAFLKIMGVHGAQKIPQPVFCPFSYPLGDIRAHAAVVDTYHGRLPTQVEQMVAQNANIPGTKTAGLVLAEFLSDRI